MQSLDKISSATANLPAVMQAPMKRVCIRLKSLGFDLSKLRGLEFFAREGDWQTISYAQEIAELDAWEIDPKFEQTLRANLPRARVRIGNSFDLATQKEYARAFDFIVYDNPQGFFGDKNQYCEHFEALETINPLIGSEAIIIFNINREPFNYDNLPDWRLRREQFYRRADTSLLDEDFLLSFYRDYFQARRLELREVFIEPRHENYLAYFVAAVAKRTD
jgi:hypothetical protein